MKEKIAKVLQNDYSLLNSDEDVAKLNCFVEMMLKYNETHNLTSITDEEDVVYKHLLDSVIPKELFNDNAKVLDIGCGAGFPSVPLAIIKPKTNFVALDSVRKKVDFVESVKNELNLDNLTTVHARIEDFARLGAEREQYDIVISRAVAALNIVLEYSAPMLRNGGLIYAYKGIGYEEEIKKAQNALKILDCEVVDVKEYDINEIDTKRYVVVIRKKSKISTKYPRIQNKPRKQPL
ncbi:MAG: 16S rRNA (guanine(527)-N(7))-methyltransferase RsmG [Clostridiales bacterium]|nr:16S rRNA (guanine(527)-N(7))-methyltransferase RsmG [Clostridiales bacterium]